MKNKAILVLLLGLAACTAEQLPEDNVPAKEPVKGEVVFSGEYAAESRLVPAAGGAVSWTMEDEIGVWDGSDYVKATVLKADGAAVSFSAAVDVNAAKYIAVTPYEAGLKDGNFSVDASGNVTMLACAAVQKKGSQVYCIAAASAEDKTFAFRNVGNIIRFNVEKDGVVKAVFKGNKDEKLAGYITVNPADASLVSSGLDVAAIEIEAAPGQNFIALPPSVDLQEGFLITLYGAGDDYLGEVPSPKSLTLGRNKMSHLGTIDGWIDNYQLWQHGKSITIAGNEYSKASTGLNGELLKAESENYDLFDKLYGKNGAFFLEQANGYKFFAHTFVNIGTNTAPRNVFLVSRFDNAPVTYSPTNHFTLMDGNMYLKGIQIKDFESGYDTNNKIFQSFTTATFGNLHFDNCLYSLNTSAIMMLRCIKPGSAPYNRGVKSIRFCNSKIESKVATRIDLLFASTDFPNLNEFEEVVFDNNVIYNANSGGTVGLFATGGPAPAEGVQRTVFKLTNNTFYNMAPTTYFQSHSMGSLEVSNNLFYSESAPTGSKIIAYSKDDTYEYPYTFENNFSNFASIYKFNPNSGVYHTLKQYITKTDAQMFTTADTSKGIFVQAPGFENCGAHQ